jgi:integrase
MPRLALTDRFIQGAKATGAAQVDYFDEKTPGLALRVSESGQKAWTFLFTAPDSGKRARMTLGRYPATTLGQARTRATEARGHLDEGNDPRRAMAEQAAGAMTVSALVESYLDKHARPNLSSANAIERRLKKNVTPIVGNVKLADLHKRDVNRCVDPILKRGRKVEAQRVFEDLRAVLRWGVARGDLDRNPADGMKKPNGNAARERVLADDEIRTLWTSLPKALAKSKTVQRIVRLCLVTGQRVGEVAGMRPAELDLKAKVWNLPGARTKNGHAHSVPLSDLAVITIKEAIEAAGKGAKFLFPNDEGDGPLDVNAIAKTIKRANEPSEELPKGRFGIEHWTAHDLRRTAVTGMAKLGVAPIVLGHVINHRSVTKAGVTLSVYSQYTYDKEKREALDLWADTLGAIIAGGAEIVPMRGKGGA